MGSTKKVATAAAVCVAMMLAFAVAVGIGPMAPQVVSGGASAASLSALDISAGDKAVSTVAFTSPVDGAKVVYATGASSVPLALFSQVDDTNGTRVTYTYGEGTPDSMNQLIANKAPYVATIPDVKGFTTLALMATADMYYGNKGPGASDLITVTVEEYTGTIGNIGLPENPFSLNLQFGNIFNNVVQIGPEFLVVSTSPLQGASKGGAPLTNAGTTVSASHPNNLARNVTATIPAGLLQPGETGLAFIQVANDLATLVGATAGDAVVTGQPAGGLVTDALYAEVSILVSTDGGATFAEIDNARLAAKPVTVSFSGTTNSAADELDIFSFSSDVTGPPIAVTAAAAGTWAKRPTVVEDGGASAQATSLSIFAPFNTPGDLSITGVSNSTANSLNGTSQFYAGGGGTVDITLANATGPDVSVIIGNGAPVNATLVGNTATVTVPAAGTFGTVAAETTVTVIDGATSDAAPDALTYVGPAVNAIDVSAGVASGGTAVNVTGEGFVSGLSADLGGSALSVGSVSSTTFAATTNAGTAGLKDLTVTLSNGYSGTLADAFTYLPPAPVLTNVTPDTVYSDGGYQVRLEGMNFVTPGTTFGALAKTAKAYGTYAQNVLFTTVNDVANESSDDAAQSLTFLDDTRIDATTPVRGSAGEFDVYVSNNTLATMKGVSNAYRSYLTPFTFLAGPAPFTIDSIVPSTGPNTGGTEVTITGANFPVAKDAFIPLDTKGTTGVTGHQIRIETQTAANGDVLTVRFFYVRGTDLAPTDPGPAAINFAFSYDPAVLTPQPIVFGNPVAGPNLVAWTGKQINAGNPSSGLITIVVSGGSTEITTVNPFNAAESENPFELGSLKFDVIGTTGDFSPLTIVPPGGGGGNEASMADSGANPLAGVNVQDGLICVDTVPCEIPIPQANIDVFFGPNEATQIPQTKGGATPSVVVSSPAVFGDAMTESDMVDRTGLLADADIFPAMGYAADVRVQDGSDPSMFAISKGGFTYTLVTDPTVNSFTPSEGWIFGGQKVTIAISGFTGVTPANTTVLFGTDAATVLSANDNEIEVVAPPSSDATPTSSAYTNLVNISVTAGTGKAGTMATSTDQYVYYRVREVSETVGSSTATVAVNAFTIPGTGGTFDLVFNTNTPPTKTAKRNTSFVSGNTGSVTFPALPTGKGLGSTVYGILRASKDLTVSGAGNLTTGTNAVGQAVGNIWNFDLHLYTDQYNAGTDSFAELTNVMFSTDVLSAVQFSFPTDDADLTQAQLNGASAWSTVGGSYDFSFGATSYSPVTTAPIFQDVVAKNDTTTSVEGTTTYVDSINNLDIYNVSQSSFAVVRNSFPPRSAIVANVNLENGGIPQAPASGTPAKTIQVGGDNIAWTESVLFQVGTKQSSAPIVPSNIGDDDKLIEVVAPASPTGGAATANVILMVRVANGTKQGNLVPINAGQVQFVGQQNFPFLQLLAAALATIGILAGGDSGGGGGGPCFVATAAYGTPMAGEIEALRAVRDSYLLNNAVGSMLVDGYYRISPAIADTVAQSPALAAATRVALLPVITLGKLLMVSPLGSVLLGAIALIATMKARRRAKAHKA